jgi:hypothetical protein
VKRSVYCGSLRNATNQFVTGQLTEGKLKYKAIQADSTEEYEVQDLLERRQGDNGPEFLVKWAGWSDQYNEWLPEAALDLSRFNEKVEINVI